uniref:HAT C-terminal dimerisation domain-containing protein n=1 Tax=Latimeria chalumnae TaxID=7897 RepID=H3BCV3_LATCH
IKLAMFGSVNIATQLDESYRVGVRKHNEEVDKNWYTLSKLIDFVWFCGAFELALCGHDETESNLNPGVVRGLGDLVSSLDTAKEKHVKTAAVFKGTSKTIQNELLDCMLDVTRDFIIQQLRNTECVAIQADDTTDVLTECQSVLLYQYIDGNSKIVERFYGLTQLKDLSLLDQLKIFLEHCAKQKLIAQSYNGASVMRGESGGIQKKVRDRYPNNAVFFFFPMMPHIDVLYSQLRKRDIDTVYLEHNQCFPLQTLTDIVHAYPMLNKERLHTELSVIYGNYLEENNLQDTFSETMKLLQILITTPMTTVESERCFSTLKRIKTFLKNTMNQDRLNALALLSMEKQL